MADLTRSGFVQAGDRIKRATHQLSLPPHLQPAGVRLRAALVAKPLDPPSRKELAPDALAQQALRFLINSGEAVELDPQIALSSRAFTQALDTIRKVLAETTRHRQRNSPGPRREPPGRRAAARKTRSRRHYSP